MSEPMHLSSRVFAEYVCIVSSAKIYMLKYLQLLRKSLEYIMKSRAPRINPCGTSLMITLRAENGSLVNLICCRIKKSLRNQPKLAPFTPYISSFSISKSFLTLSNALLKSRKIQNCLVDMFNCSL